MKITIPAKINSFQKAEVHFFPEIQSSKIRPSQNQKNGAASSNEYRILLRQKLSEHLSQRGVTQMDPSILNLAQLPRQHGWSISLSHCPLGSAFVALAISNLQVGIDVEAMERLSQPIVDRIAQPLEQNLCPKPLHLFSAKECSWKALNQNYQLATLSHLETVIWTTHTQDWLSFKVQINDQVLDGQGLTTEIGPICMALYLQN